MRAASPAGLAVILALMSPQRIYTAEGLRRQVRVCVDQRMRPAVPPAPFPTLTLAGDCGTAHGARLRAVHISRHISDAEGAVTAEVVVAFRGGERVRAKARRREGGYVLRVARQGRGQRYRE